MLKCRFLILFLFLLSGCAKNTSYNVTGIIKEIHYNTYKLLIDHDKIPGFMEPMVMFFNIHKSVDLNQFQINDSVMFNLVITKKSHYSLNFNILGKGQEKNNDIDFLTDNNEIYRPFKVGEQINDVSFTTTDNKIFRLSENNNELTIISYIFSRCPMPDMCPAIVSNNQFLANSFKENNNIKFLLLSFDYLYDTPKVLSNKYKSMENTNNNMIFLSSVNHFNDLVLLTKQSNLNFWGIEENNIGHTMRTIIIDRDRILLKTYDGIDWKPGDVKNDIIQLLALF